jgi:hypothetical protein
MPIKNIVQSGLRDLVREIVEGRLRSARDTIDIGGSGILAG